MPDAGLCFWRLSFCILSAIKTINTAGVADGVDYEVCDTAYSPGMIASLGQTLAQVPQSMQVSGSMW